MLPFLPTPACRYPYYSSPGEDYKPPGDQPPKVCPSVVAGGHPTCGTGLSTALPARRAFFCHLSNCPPACPPAPPACPLPCLQEWPAPGMPTDYWNSSNGEHWWEDPERSGHGPFDMLTPPVADALLKANASSTVCEALSSLLEAASTDLPRCGSVQ